MQKQAIISIMATKPPNRNVALRKEKSLRVLTATQINPAAPRTINCAAFWMAPGAIRIGEIVHRNENNSFRDHINNQPEVLAGKGSGAIGNAPCHPTDQHVSSQNEESIQTEHFAGKHLRDAGIKKDHFCNNDCQYRSKEMSIRSTAECRVAAITLMSPTCFRG